MAVCHILSWSSVGSDEKRWKNAIVCVNEDGIERAGCEAGVKPCGTRIGIS